jgi:hypothetical protein
MLSATSLPHSVVCVALLYIHRLKTLRPRLQGQEGSEFRLLVCALMLAMKFLVDNTYSNKTWAKLANIPLREINLTEMEFVTQIKYNLAVTPAQFYRWQDEVNRAMASYQVLNDNYTQNHVYSPSPIRNHFIQSPVVPYPSPTISPVNYEIVANYHYQNQPGQHQQGLHQLSGQPLFHSDQLSVNPISHQHLPDQASQHHLPNQSFQRPLRSQSAHQLSYFNM